MGEDEPGWYYVGNDQFRYMDADGWTVKYKPRVDATKSDVGPQPPPEIVRPDTRESAPRQSATDPSSFIRLSTAAANRLIALLTPLMAGLWRYNADGYRDGSASLSKRSIARQQLP